ncbi:hypothetical protein AV654_03045 [Paenibacillus elgii]|uniref:Uncharacterized protein n=1 Tax=Paenibacillus elgii TaxID=189691 RepID=A0A163WQI3_9BACL|nr:hypothetical protein [Paenibacillus elgii]KZE76691.1 hypothetical protein AV654_03045 [Paenibacillus elgii]
MPENDKRHGERLVNPYIGRPIGAFLPDGEFVCGIVECVHNGNLVLRPLGIPEAAVQNIKNRIATNPRFRKSHLKCKRNMKQMTIKEKARIKAFGGFGYPFGWGYGNWGWGAGLDLNSV